MKKTLLAAALFAVTVVSPAASDPLEAFSLKFTAQTNVGFSIEGAAQKINEVDIDIDVEKNLVRHFHLMIDPASLDTGMATRNRHMLEKVFTSADGRQPPIEVSGADVILEPCGEGEYTGAFNVSFRGENQSVPVRIKILSITQAQASATIDLSRFGVNPIALMGVKVKDAVKISIDEVRIRPRNI